jgi:Arc/MetJ-type ribon-helix-helix transcriptional regulator
MKSLTVRLPEKLMAEIEQESRVSRISVSEVVRERLRRAPEAQRAESAGVMELIGDLVGSVDGLPADLSGRRKHYLRSSGYGGNHSGGQRLPRRTPKPQ